MRCCVLDTSATLSWFLSDENVEQADALLDEVSEAGAVAPSLWSLEVANVLLIAQRRRRITLAERHQALAFLTALPIQVESQTAIRAWTDDTLRLAESCGLTVYDASYLEAALRLALPLASLDQALCQAAADSGVRLIL